MSVLLGQACRRGRRAALPAAGETGRHTIIFGRHQVLRIEPHPCSGRPARTTWPWMREAWSAPIVGPDRASAVLVRRAGTSTAAPPAWSVGCGWGLAHYAMSLAATCHLTAISVVSLQQKVVGQHLIDLQASYSCAQYVTTHVSAPTLQTAFGSMGQQCLKNNRYLCTCSPPLALIPENGNGCADPRPVLPM